MHTKSIRMQETWRAVASCVTTSIRLWIIFFFFFTLFLIPSCLPFVHIFIDRFFLLFSFFFGFDSFYYCFFPSLPLHLPRSCFVCTSHLWTRTFLSDSLRHCIQIYSNSPSTRAHVDKTINKIIDAVSPLQSATSNNCIENSDSLINSLRIRRTFSPMKWHLESMSTENIISCAKFI